MQEIIEVANYASSQSDRWLFVALLFIGLICTGGLFRYFTGKIDIIQKRMDEQTEDFICHLQTANKDMLNVLSLATTTIERNTRLFERLDSAIHTQGFARTRAEDILPKE